MNRKEVYIIQNIKNGKRYAGIGVTAQDRWNAHKLDAAHGRGYYLARAIRKYGPEGFSVTCVYAGPEKIANEIESGLIEHQQLQDRRYGYNIRPGGSRSTHSEETREKLRRIRRDRPESVEALRRSRVSASQRNRSAEAKAVTSEKLRRINTGKRHGPETRAKISEAQKHRRPPSAETRRKMSEGIRAAHKNMPPEAKAARAAKISKALTGKRLSPERVARMSAQRKGRKHSEEAKAKIGAAMKGRYMSPEHKAKIALANTGKRPSDETRAKMSASHRGKTIPPEQRAKISASMKAWRNKTSQ